MHKIDLDRSWKNPGSIFIGHDRSGSIRLAYRLGSIRADKNRSESISDTDRSRIGQDRFSHTSLKLLPSAKLEIWKLEIMETVSTTFRTPWEKCFHACENYT